MIFALPLRLAAAVVIASLLGPTARATADEDQSVEARDALGRAIVLPRAAERIVAIPMPSAAMVVAVDQSADRLVGMHSQAGADAGRQILARLFPAFADVSTSVVGAGFMPNVEEIIGAQPDLILQWGDRGDALTRPMEAVGLTVAALTYGGESEVRHWLTMIAALTGQSERAEALIGWRNSVLERLSPLAALPEADRPKTLYLLRARSGLIASGADTFNDESIGIAGGRNAAEGIEGSRPVNAEQVLAWDPQVILLNTFEAGLTPDVIKSHPLLGLTKAAQDGRVHVMPIGGYRWDPPNAESPLSWLWLAKTLHPEHSGITEEDMIAAIIDGYKLLYAKTVDRALALEILHTSQSIRDPRQIP